MKPEIKGTLPGPKAQKIIDLDAKYSSPSYIKEYPLVVERGEGPWIYDVDGNRYLDFMAGIAVNSTGHSHPKVVAAIKNAADKFQHICATDFYYDSFSKMCEKLGQLLPGMGPKKVFLTNSGTEAVEGAIKLARFHSKRSNIIAFKGGFHGRTMGAISLTSSKARQRAFFGPLVPGITHVNFPNTYHGIEAPDLEKELFTGLMDPKEVAAIFLEPMLGEGGYIIPEKKFIQYLRTICDKYGILLIFDEIQTGVGRTGYMYAADYFGVAPDILLTAKGLASGMPLGAIIAKESVMSWTRGTHGSTYGGNPICCEAGLATIEIVEGLIPQVKANGEYFLTKLRELQKKYPRIGDVRGAGYFIGVEFVEPGTKTPAAEWVGELEQLAFRKGLLLLSCGQSTIRLAPPLVVGKHEIDVGLAIMEECFKELR
jgi:4-aminobutyrate aminotransferase